MQGMAELKATVWVIDSILEKLQQLRTVSIQITYYVRHKPVVKAFRNQGFCYFQLNVIFTDIGGIFRP